MSPFQVVLYRCRSVPAVTEFSVIYEQNETTSSDLECLMNLILTLQAVNDICILPGSGRLASCDGTIHIWNAHSGQRLALFDESTTSPLSSSSSVPSPGSATDTAKTTVDVQNGNGASVSPYSLAASLTGGGLYNRLHSMEAEQRLVGGMVNGSLRYSEVYACHSYLKECFNFGLRRFTRMNNIS